MHTFCLLISLSSIFSISTIEIQWKSHENVPTRKDLMNIYTSQCLIQSIGRIKENVSYVILPISPKILSRKWDVPDVKIPMSFVNCLITSNSLTKSRTSSSACHGTMNPSLKYSDGMRLLYFYQSQHKRRWLFFLIYGLSLNYSLHPQNWEHFPFSYLCIILVLHDGIFFCVNVFFLLSPSNL